MDYPARRRNLVDEFERLKVDVLLVLHPVNIRYLTGFTGSAGALLMGPRPLLVCDGRYTEQAREQTEGVRLVTSGKEGLLARAARETIAAKVTRVGIESEHLTVKSRTLLAGLLPGAKLVPTSGVIEALRMRKEPAEVALIREAVLLGARVFPPALRTMRPGRSELEVAARLEYDARRHGAEGMSFETIIASGVRSALPHGVASASPLPQRGFVVLDYGVILHGYCSDMTRTVYLGRPSERAKDWYKAVLDAQLAAIAAVAPGAGFADVDRAARSSLKRSGLAKFFTHSTGHGVGLEIHEPPRLAANQQGTLAPGMVITIEPGIYVSGKGGIRIEDMVLVTAGGCEVLTPVDKELIQL